MVACSLVLRPIFEKLFRQMLLLRNKKSFERMHDSEYRLRGVARTEPSTTSTTLATKIGESDPNRDSSSVSELRDLPHVRGSIDRLRRDMIRVQTDWEVSTVR